MAAPRIKPPRTVADLVSLTGLSQPSVLNGLKNGELPGFRVGRRWVIPADAFDAFAKGIWEPQPKPVTPLPAPQLLHTKAKAS